MDSVSSSLTTLFKMGAIYHLSVMFIPPKFNFDVTQILSSLMIQFEREIIGQLDALVEGGRGDLSFKGLFKEM